MKLDDETARNIAGLIVLLGIVAAGLMLLAKLMP